MPASTNQSASVVLGTTATSTANRVVAANSNANRYIRSVHAVNATASAATINVGMGAAATLVAANANVAFGLSIPANSNTPVYYAGGKGLRASGANTEIMAFASAATTITLLVVYDDDLFTL